MSLSVLRKSMHPQTKDNWRSIAKRELAQVETEAAVSQLQSWNLHVFMRPSLSANHAILPSDVIFLEAPLV